MKMVEKCKVKGCKNRVMEIREEGKHESMKGTYGYCQIHNIEGLVEEVDNYEKQGKNPKLKGRN